MHVYIKNFIVGSMLLGVLASDANVRNRPSFAKLNPIEIPKQLPPIEKIAQTITSSLEPNQFMFGASTSEHQFSKECTPEICSASEWAAQHGYALPTDSTYIMDWWHHYANYIDDAISQMKLNTIRFSIEMAIIQPNGPDSWNMQALQHYADLYGTCLRKGVTPIVCFHHYTDPVWFIKKGGFESIDNVPYFVDQCKKVYEYIMTSVSKDCFALIGLKSMYPRVPLWVTFNAPEAYAFRSYYAGTGAPSHPDKKGLGWVAEVIKNCCDATVQVSKALKESYRSHQFHCLIEEPSVGFLKNIHQVDAADQTIFQKISAPITKACISLIDRIRNDAIFDFFCYGRFKVSIPCSVSIDYENKDAIGSIDFIGLNYYSNRYMSLSTSVKHADKKCHTDGEYYIYPQGIYRAIVQLYHRFVWPYQMQTKKQIPVFVAENGIATKDHVKRSYFYHTYLYAVSKAVEDGYPIYGYTPWALCDNYEWPSLECNTKRNYGICEPINDGTHLALKEGSRVLADFGEAIC